MIFVVVQQDNLHKLIILQYDFLKCKCNRQKSKHQTNTLVA